MAVLCVIIGLAAALTSVVACAVVLRVSRRAGAFDTAPMPGQFKEAARRVPNTGGIGLVAGVVVPLLAGAGLVAGGALAGDEAGSGGVWAAAAAHAEGLRGSLPLLGLLVGCVLGVHGLGLVDDRRPLGPWLKLVLLLCPPLVLATLGETRLLELLDGAAGGAWLSVGVTAAWFLAVTNAMNFIDNMDGASAGVGAIASAALLAAAAVGGQWFVAWLAAATCGACLGFLVWNFPRARLFMGDGGSLVLGLLLAFLSVRLTYTGRGPTGEEIGTRWWAVLAPVVVLAVPLYDMLSVTLMRVRQGRSPMLGDLQHLSHRLVKRGLSRRDAVLVLWGLTAATAVSGVSLGSLAAWQAVLVLGQVGVLLGVLALLEFGSSPPGARPDTLETGVSAARERARANGAATLGEPAADNDAAGVERGRRG